MNGFRPMFKLVVGLLLLLITVTQPACNVQPYCLDCTDSGSALKLDIAGLTDDIGGDIAQTNPDGGPCVATGNEICDGIDNDCDGQIDNGEVAQVGETCGSAVGECKQGTYVCTEGQLTCDGETAPTGEQCNGLDDDCDGTPDNGNPGGGVLCGNGTGACVQGTTVCDSGEIKCTGGTQPAPEECDGIDNDCNGDIDDGNPGGGADCGAGDGVCVLGTVTCLGGKLTCIGAGGPVDEICNGKDDNCDGHVDEGFNTAIDVDNCGMCGIKCTLAGATPTCSAGECKIKFCDPDHWDIDKDPANGCEYACVKSGVEICNGKDDDCDGTIDNKLSAAPAICAKLGECAGTVATCDGTPGWVCHYPASASTNTAGELVPETDCDNKDNDCNGKTDDLFPNRLKSCTKGLGACQTKGTQVCNSTHDALTCNAATPGDGTPEVCDGIDNDCNGMLDDGAPDLWVTIGGGVQMYQYEASHPDAKSDGSTTGTLTHRSCSSPNRLPWVNVLYSDAKAACEAAGARLCTEAEWQGACQAQNTCTWSNGPAASCNTYTKLICNDNNYDVDLAKPNIQNKALPTGSLPMCYADWTTAGKIYDLSGNVKEWTTARAPGINPYRGGSFTSPKDGTNCTENFALGDDLLLFNNIGFRCCK